MQKKALALMSGGLDSTLAAKLMKDQGIEVIGLHFTCSLFNSEREGKGNTKSAERAAASLGIPLRVVFFDKDYIDLVKHPRHGWGQGANPCIDCHAFMFVKARKMMEELGASFLVSGEVLGQRPMSQRREAMRMIDNETGTKGLLLRPLSARHFEPTEPEKAGIVDREKLLAIRGRSRKTQMALADEIGVTGYPSPGGGCLLTDPIYSGRVFDLFARKENPDFDDFNLLKIGRLVRMDGDLRIIIGREHEENLLLEKYRDRFDAILEPVGPPGASAAMLGAYTQAELHDAGRMIARYSRKVRLPLTIKWAVKGEPKGEFTVEEAYPEDELHRRLI